MNNETAELLKKYGILSSIFLLAVLIIWGLAYISSIFHESVFKTAAETILKESPLCTAYRNVKVEKMKSIYYKKALFIPAALAASDGEVPYTILFVKLSGKYGMYQGVFLYEEKNGAVFCGLAGNLDLNRSSDYYGITPAIINFWCKKINILLRKMD